ncbi:hemerythrin [Rhabdochromatium marinum]|nr:hemerythrin [Rhabdochromatium marinum]
MDQGMIKAKFSIGHDRIDHEHQVFLDLMINVSRANEDGSSQERVLRLLEEVKKYAEFHFFSEENVMIDAKYPEYDAHHKEHRILIAALDSKVYDYCAGQLDLDALVEFLFEWFALHTTGSDKRIAQYLSG